MYICICMRDTLYYTYTYIYIYMYRLCGTEKIAPSYGGVLWRSLMRVLWRQIAPQVPKSLMAALCGSLMRNVVMEAQGWGHKLLDKSMSTKSYARSYAGLMRAQDRAPAQLWSRWDPQISIRWGILVSGLVRRPCATKTSWQSLASLCHQDLHKTLD